MPPSTPIPGTINPSTKLLALGAYSDVPLKGAREKRDETRKLVADGIDPSARSQAARSAAANTFKAVTDE